MKYNCLLCFCKFNSSTLGRRFCSVRCSNSFNLNNQNKIDLPRYGSELAELVGICLGDGYAGKYQVEITLNSVADKDYIPYVKSLLIKLFPAGSLTIFKRPSEQAISLKINSNLISKFLKKQGIVANSKFVPKWIFREQKYINSCIRGLFDTEGSISYKVYKGKYAVSLYKQLNFTNFNLELMTFVRDGLIKLGFKPTMTLRRSLYLSNHKDIDKFRDLIGFSNPKLVRRSLIKTFEEYLQLGAKQ